MKCQTCMFYRALGTREISVCGGQVIKHNCHYWPKITEVTPHHWCGQWKSPEEKEVNKNISDMAFLKDYERRKKDNVWISKEEKKRYDEIVKGNAPHSNKK